MGERGSCELVAGEGPPPAFGDLPQNQKPILGEDWFGEGRSDCDFWGMLGFEGCFVKWGKWRDMVRKFPL